MGTKSDLRTRIRHARVDSSDGQKFLEKARSYVFKGFKVDGSKVGGIKGMDSESRTPTRVGSHSLRGDSRLMTPTEYFFDKA